MSTRYLEVVNGTSDPRYPANRTNAKAAGVYVDSNDSYKLKVNQNGTVAEVKDSVNVPKTSANVGAVASGVAATASAVEYGDGIVHKTVITLTALPLTLADATQGAGVELYDFPEGDITILGSSGSVAETTTSTLASTLNASATYNWGVGTTTQANGTLATTEQDIIPTTNGTASATINVAGAASAAGRASAPACFDGHASAKKAFFNVGIATATDIDADATTVWSGTITIVWTFNGDV